MGIDWNKTGLYVVVAVAVMGYLVWHQPVRPPLPAPEPQVVVVDKPVVAPAVAEKPAPVAKKHVKKAPPPKNKPFVARPVNLSPGCSLVPAEAYKWPLDVDVHAATRVGTSAANIALLKRCWNGERVN